MRAKCLAQENNAMSPAFVHQESHTQPLSLRKINCPSVVGHRYKRIHYCYRNSEERLKRRVRM